MVLQLDIDERREKATVSLEDLRGLFNVKEHAAFCRVQLLETAIEEAVRELAKTKTSFKSKRIKEVRENLTGVLVSRRTAGEQEHN